MHMKNIEPRDRFPNPRDPFGRMTAEGSSHRGKLNHFRLVWRADQP